MLASVEMVPHIAFNQSRIGQFGVEGNRTLQFDRGVPRSVDDGGRLGDGKFPVEAESVGNDRRHELFHVRKWQANIHGVDVDQFASLHLSQCHTRLLIT